MGGRGVKLGKMVKWVYERTRVVLPASDWVTFLMDFSFELFVGVGPCRFLWQARNSLLQWVRSEQQREEKKKKVFSAVSKRTLSVCLGSNENYKLFHYSAYFCYYSWVSLHFLVLFMFPLTISTNFYLYLQYFRQ